MIRYQWYMSIMITEELRQPWRATMRKVTFPRHPGVSKGKRRMLHVVVVHICVTIMMQLSYYHALVEEKNSDNDLDMTLVYLSSRRMEI